MRIYTPEPVESLTNDSLSITPLVEDMGQGKTRKMEHKRDGITHSRERAKIEFQRKWACFCIKYVAHTVGPGTKCWVINHRRPQDFLVNQIRSKVSVVDSITPIYHLTGLDNRHSLHESSA